MAWPPEPVGHRRVVAVGSAPGVRPEMVTETPPAFVVKATDVFAYPLIVQYARLCRDFGHENQAREVSDAAEELRLWQEANPERVHLPTHKHVPHQDPVRGLGVGI